MQAIQFFTRLRTVRAQLLASILALLVGLALAGVTDRYLPGNEELLLLAPGIAFCALFCGLVSGGVVAFLSSLGDFYFFQEPFYRFGIHSGAQAFEMFFLLSIAGFVSWAGGLLRKAYRNVENARRAAEDATRSREELLAMVSHDLKNPITSIKLAIELLSNDDSPKNNDGSKKILASIQRSCDAALRLIRSLLDFERIRAGKLILNLRTTEVKRLLSDIREVLGPIATQKRLTLDIVEPSAASLLWCDPERIHQAIGNLVGNAMKFTPAGGTIRVEAIESEAHLLFRVTDTGPGIPEEQVRHLFEKYWQEGKTAHLGIGLGLSIVKGVAEAHGGFIQARSQLGKGSTFEFTVPRSLASRPASPA